MALSLSPAVFAILQPLIEDRLGLHHDLEDRELLAAKLSTRALELGFESLLDYYYFLRYDEGGARELELLADHLVVNETYFFRELRPLELVADELARLVRSRPLATKPRVWSAACATGEEPLTLAMLLAARDVLDDVEIVASDISSRVLAAARSGRFGRRSLRQETPAFAKPFLAVDAEGRARVRPDLTEHVSWRRVNLLDGAAVAALGAFDAIVCRNVLIYFADDTVTRVINTLTTALNNGGALYVGVSESLLRYGTSLTCEEQAGVFLYRKVER